MTAKNDVTEKVAHAKVVRKFFADLFVYLQFASEDINPKITQIRRDDKCTENIVKAVRVANFILYDYMVFFFRKVTFPQTFKTDVERVLFDWLTNRTNIFVKVIDASAFIFEAYMYNLLTNKLKLSLNESIEWLTQLFQENFSNEFFTNGGWKELHLFSRDKYALLHNNFKNLADSDMFENALYVLDSYKCKMMKSVRKSYINYPIPQNFACLNCKSIFDDDHFRKIVYMMEVEEYDEREQELLKNNTGHDTVYVMEAENKESLQELLANNIFHSDEISNISGLNGDPTVKASLPSLFTDLGQPSKEICEKVSSNNLLIECDSVVAPESELLDLFIQELKLKFSGDKSQTEKELNQTKLLLISNNFSNSFSTLLKKMYLNNVDENKKGDLTFLKENLQMLIRSGEKISETDYNFRFQFSEMKFRQWTFGFYFLGKLDETV